MTFGDPGLGVIQKKKPFIRFAHLQVFVFLSLLKASFQRSEIQNPAPLCSGEGLFLLSGWQDSNLRPSGPKPDALTGLRYTPNNILSNIKRTKPDALIPKNKESPIL